jgi:2-succinyl-6-hydroxy-2,4-cyclohexadiene-1-carboxylate synthase
MRTGSHRSLWADLEALKTPLLLLAGEHDLKYTDLNFDMAARCPRAEVLIVRGRGHALVEEDPESVMREIAAFLDAG